MRYWRVYQKQTYRHEVPRGYLSSPKRKSDGTPNADHPFDRGFIGFSDRGDVLISPVAHRESLARLGIDPRSPPNVGQFSEAQRRYLDFHRENVLLRSRFLG